MNIGNHSERTADASTASGCTSLAIIWHKRMMSAIKHRGDWVTPRNARNFWMRAARSCA